MEEITIESLQDEIQSLKVELKEADEKISKLQEERDFMQEALRDIEQLAGRHT